VRRHLGVDPEEFEHRYVTHMWGRPSFVERPGGDCVFYDAETAKCAIYSLRPLQCSLFPFWPSVMESRADWDREARWCPGMDDGRLYGEEEIRSRLRQCPFEDL
jgi:Fe-S-cluster containining protein